MDRGAVENRAWDTRPAREARSVSAVLSIALGLAACSGSAREFPDAPTPLQQQMYAHFQEALELRAGAIFGAPERVRTAGEFLAGDTSAEGLPRGSDRYLQVLQRAGAAAAESSDDDAATAAAEVARACGNCHQRYEVGPRFVIGAPAPGGSLATHMGRQDRISRLLWDGLIGPSDATWAAGALELAEEPAFPAELMDRVDAGRAEGARRELQRLGTRAETVTDPRERTVLLGEVWTVCAGCHRAAEVPGPGR